MFFHLSLKKSRKEVKIIKTTSKFLKMNLQKRMMAFILLPAIACLLLSSAITLMYFQPIFRGEVEHNVGMQSEKEATAFNEDFLIYEYIVSGMASQAATCMESTNKSEWQHSMEIYLKVLLIENVFLADTWFAFKPGAIWNETSQSYMSDYMPLYEPGIEEATYYTNYLSEIYYATAAASDDLVWTAPYYDPVIEMPLVSATHPIFVEYENGTSEFVGCF